MKAIVVASDTRRSLRWQEVPEPTLGPGEVLINARATAVNRADLLQRKGRYAPPPGASEILGLEVAGEVVQCGEQVSGWSVGDRVCALLPGGGYAQYVVCPAELLLRVPGSLSFAEAAALPEALYTSYLNLYVEGRLRPSEHALIHAGASGIGTVAIQLCAALGSPVFATASAAKLPRLLQLGATAVFEREREDFVAGVQGLTEGRGVDVILDPVGGSYLTRNLAALAVGGRLVVIGLLGGAKGELPLGELLTRRLRIIGSVLRGRSVAEKAELTRELERRVWPLVATGKIRAVIDRVFAVTDAEAAHTLLQSNETTGKLVLTLPR